MRLIFTTKIGAQFFLANGTTGPCPLSGNPCTAMVSMRRDLQILRLRPKFWELWGGEQVSWWFFLGGIFDRWESDLQKDSTKRHFRCLFFTNLGSWDELGRWKKNTRRTHQKKADDMSTDAAVPMVQWTWNKNMVGNPSDSFRWMPGFLQMPTSLVPGEMLMEKTCFFFWGGGHKTSKLPVDQTHKTTWGQTQTHTHTHTWFDMC